MSSTAAFAACSGETVFFKDSDFSVETLSYKPEALKSYVLIIPPTGGTNIIDKSYARNLCKEGIQTYVLSHWTKDDEYNLELAIHTRFYARAYRAVGLVLKNLPKGKEIGLLGTSVGGLHAAIAASRYPEITRAFIITGGAHIPSITANSNQEAMRTVWEKRRTLFKFQSKAQYIEALEKVIELEPLNRLTIATPKKFGMVISSEDKTVPTINQERLKSLWKPEKIRYENYDHFWTIVKTWLFHADDIYDFFK
jgi:pimeloyl-ACP methyl ester carboxylesterase